jgi:hypothetical protein
VFYHYFANYHYFAHPQTLFFTFSPRRRQRRRQQYEDFQKIFYETSLSNAKMTLSITSVRNNWMFRLIDNVFYRHFARYRHFDRRDLGLHSTMTATATSKTSNIYYVMCLEARFYEYLVSSEVRNELSSKLVTVTFAS